MHCAVISSLWLLANIGQWSTDSMSGVNSYSTHANSPAERSARWWTDGPRAWVVAFLFSNSSCVFLWSESQIRQWCQNKIKKNKKNHQVRLLDPAVFFLWLIKLTCTIIRNSLWLAALISGWGDKQNRGNTWSRLGVLVSASCHHFWFHMPFQAGH